MTDTEQSDDAQALVRQMREAYERDRPPGHVRTRAVARYAAERAKAESSALRLPGFARWGYVAVAVVAVLALSNLWLADTADDPVTLATVARIQLPQLPTRPVLPSELFAHRTAVPELVGLTTPRAPTERHIVSLKQSGSSEPSYKEPVLNGTHNEDC